MFASCSSTHPAAHSWLGEVLPAWLLSLPRRALENCWKERSEPFFTQYIPVMGEIRLNSVFQASVSPRNSGPLFIICITVAPRGPKLVRFVEHFVGDGYYSYLIKNDGKNGKRRKKSDLTEVLWSIIESKTPALSVDACAAKHWGHSISRSCSAFSSAIKNDCLLTSSPSSAVEWVNPFYSTLQQIKSTTMTWLRTGGTFRCVCSAACDQLSSHARAPFSACTANFTCSFSLEIILWISA